MPPPPLLDMSTDERFIFKTLVPEWRRRRRQMQKSEGVALNRLYSYSVRRTINSPLLILRAFSF